MSETNVAVAAIIRHHEHLASALTARTAAVLSAARTGADPRPAVSELRTLIDTEIVPHARAEEDVLYAAAPPSVAALVTGMVQEHEVLLGLAAELGAVATVGDAAGVARAFDVMFAAHLRKENELLLPVLAADTDLPAELGRMEERFGAYREAALAAAAPASAGQVPAS